MSLETRLAAFASRAAQEDKALRSYVDGLPFGNQWGPADVGYKAWSYDPSTGNTGQAGGTGILYLNRMPIRQATTISSLLFYVLTAGASLTNVGVGLYTDAGALLASTVNSENATAAKWQASGLKTVTITPQSVEAGFYYAAYWATGTTQPAMLRSSSTGVAINTGFTLDSGTGLRFARANNGLTNVAPATAVQVGDAVCAFWAAMA